MVELARERERRANSGLVGAGLDRAQGLARKAGAPGQFVLGEAARGTGAAYHCSAVLRHSTFRSVRLRHYTCQTACIMA